jgi:hypothetical protein
MTAVTLAPDVRWGSRTDGMQRNGRCRPHV